MRICGYVKEKVKGKRVKVSVLINKDLRDTAKLRGINLSRFLEYELAEKLGKEEELVK